MLWNCDEFFDLGDLGNRAADSEEMSSAAALIQRKSALKQRCSTLIFCSGKKFSELNSARGFQVMYSDDSFLI